MGCTANYLVPIVCLEMNYLLLTTDCLHGPDRSRLPWTMTARDFYINSSVTSTLPPWGAILITTGPSMTTSELHYLLEKRLPWAAMKRHGLQLSAIDCHGLARPTMDCNGPPWDHRLPWRTALITCYSFAVEDASWSLTHAQRWSSQVVAPLVTTRLHWTPLNYILKHTLDLHWTTNAGHHWAPTGFH